MPGGISVVRIPKVAIRVPRAVVGHLFIEARDDRVVVIQQYIVAFDRQLPPPVPLTDRLPVTSRSPNIRLLSCV